MNNKEVAINIMKIFIERENVNFNTTDVTEVIETYAKIYNCILWELEEKDIINKATKYLEKIAEEPTFGMETEIKNTEHFKELFKILKGSDK